MTGVKKFGLAVWTVIVLLVGFLMGYVRGFDDAYEFSSTPPRLGRHSAEDSEE